MKDFKCETNLWTRCDGGTAPQPVRTQDVNVCVGPSQGREGAAQLSHSVQLRRLASLLARATWVRCCGPFPTPQWTRCTVRGQHPQERDKELAGGSRWKCTPALQHGQPGVHSARGCSSSGQQQTENCAAHAGRPACLRAWLWSSAEQRWHDGCTLCADPVRLCAYVSLAVTAAAAPQASAEPCALPSLRCSAAARFALAC